jgi:TonB family protein
VTLLLLLVMAAEVRPPVLLEEAWAEYPAQAAAERREGVVGLRLTLDERGLVTAAEVAEPAGSGFDEAAQVAAQRLRFSPATLDGRAVPVQFLYRWHFALASAREDAGVLADAGAPDEAPPLAAAPADPGTRQTLVRGSSLVRRLRGSAEAVTVLETTVARQRSSDLGEVLARTQGVTVRRSAGLGSTATFSLNGLEGDQIRMFLDGVPLELAGYPFGLWNVPVNLVQRVELFRGVVPVRFGADALGGAVNLVSDTRPGTGAAASYQVGSFGTHRATLSGSSAGETWSLRADGFFDRALNDYQVDVEVADPTGQISSARVKRFHDGYSAGGGSVQLSLRDLPGVRSLSLRVFGSAYDKQLQNNPVMTVPYGEASYGELVAGATLRSEHQLLESLSLEALVSYSYRQVHFLDVGEQVYDWFGAQLRKQDIAGETDATPHDQAVWEHTGFARLRLDWHPLEAHTFSLAVTPTLIRRTGDERRDTGGKDPLNAQRGLFTVVSGLEWQLEVLPFKEGERRLENKLFVKHYLYSGSSGELVAADVINPVAWSSSTFGVGDGFRVHATDWLTLKASYEYTTRLPRADETFGNGVLIRENLQLEPEVSHNVNLGPRLEVKLPWLGSLGLEVNGFLRDSDQLIVLLGQTMFLQYQNVARARALGAEGQLAWSSPREWLNLSGSLTWQDLRNVSPEGTFARYDGDRVPNRPWLFGSWGASVRLKHLLADDELEPFYAGRYVHEFYRTWESVGQASSKQSTPVQLTHAVGVTYSSSLPWLRASVTAEVQNLTDARVYDVFGAQKPGRAFYVKFTAEVR